MRLNKQWLRERLIAQFPASEAFAKKAHTEAYRSGEPQQAMAAFLEKRSQGRAR
jgi:hypothetical protein